MKNHLVIWIVVILFAVFYSANAQITITQSSFPGAGFSYTSHLMMNGVNFNVGSAGANQTWTFENYEWDNNTLTEILNPGSTPYGSLFPTATRAIHATGGSSYMFERIVANGYYLLGSVSANDTTIYDPEWLTALLPATYQTTWTFALHNEQELEPGFIFLIIDSTASLVDGWGTCNTPYGSFPVLRVFSHHWNQTFLNGEPMASSEFLSYAWINSQGISVVTVDSDDDVVDPNFNYGLIEMTESSTPADPVRGPLAHEFAVEQNYPNPFNPTTVLPVELVKNTQVTLMIYDELGRKVSTQEMELSAGHHDLQIDGSRWSTGNYFAQVSADGQTATKRMLLVK
jgi:hypothetical protein